MDDATYERVVDRRVQRALAVDRAYRNAENAEQQAEREEEITRNVEARLGAELARNPNMLGRSIHASS